MKPGSRLPVAMLALVILVLVIWFLGRGNESVGVELQSAILPPVVPIVEKVLEPRTQRLTEEEPAPDQGSAPLLKKSAPPKAILVTEDPECREDDHGRHVFELDIEVVDAFDRPLYGAAVCVGPERHPINFAGNSGADGHCLVRWRAHVDHMQVVVAVSGPRKTWSGLRSLKLSATTRRGLRIVLPGELQFSQQQIRTSSQTASEDTISIIDKRVVSHHQTPDLFYGVPSLYQSDDAALFSWSSSFRDYYFREMGGQGIFLHNPRAELRRQSRMLTALELKLNSIPVKSITSGRLLDAFLIPAPGALVAAEARDGAPAVGAYCDGEGRFEFFNLGPGIWNVSAGGGDNGAQLAQRESRSGDTSWGEFVLDRGHELVGELSSQDGQPLGDWWVEVETDDDGTLHHDVTRTDDAGRFAIPNLPDAAHRILARPHDPARIFPSMVMRVASVDDFQRISVANAIDLSVLVEIHDPLDEELKNVELRIWQENSGRGSWCHRVDEFEFATPPLPIGAYRMVAISESSGRSKEVHIRINEEGGPSKVKIDFSTGGAVSFVGGRSYAKERAYALWMMGAEVDSSVVRSKNRVPDRMNLPAGEYALDILEDGRRLPSIQFVVMANSESIIEVPDEEN